MSPVAAFFASNIVTVYFVYGLAFFSMGLAILLESRRTSELPLARAMTLLAAFGLMHGIHEWVDMAQLLAGATNPELNSWPVEMLRMVLFDGSFLFLFAFGARLIAGEKQWPWGVWLLAAGAGLFWAVSTLLAGLWFDPAEREWFAMADVLGRYLLAIPASALTSWALIRQQKVLQDRGMPAFGRDVLLAAVAFFLYGVIGQAFVRPTLIFPSTLVNTGLFIYLFGFPVQVFRTVMAVVIAVTLIRALRAFDAESRQRLEAANEARLLAQQRMLVEQRKRQEETSQLNAELRSAARELTVLYDLSRIVSSTLELDTLLKEAVSRIAHSVEPVQAASIWLFDESSGDLALMACDGCGSSDLGQGVLQRNLVRAAMNTGCAMGLYPTGAIAPVVGESPTRRTSDGTTHEMWPRAVSVPLLRKGKTVGGLLLEVSTEESGISSSDVPLVGAMSVPLSLAVENALLYRDVKRREATRGELLHRIVSAQEAERRRVARELHDETGQALTALALGLKGTAETIKSNPKLAAQQLDELRGETGDALDALRRLVADLRPAQLDDLGLVAALRWYVEDFATRVPVQAEIAISGNPRRLDAVVESVLFRIAQEALTNVAKHAGANHVQVTLEFSTGGVKLIVADDGIGFSPEQMLRPTARRKSYGLLGMQERADLVNGVIRLNSKPRQGAEVVVEVATGAGAGRDEEDKTPTRG